MEKVNQETAILEIQQFVEKYDEKKRPDYEIEQDYPHVIEAIKLGLLSFDENLKPVLELKYPILDTEGNVAVKEINFRTRIKPQQLSDIMKGLDISKNQIEYTLRCFAYLTGQEKAILNKMEKFDYKVIEQISTVFL